MAALAAAALACNWFAPTPTATPVITLTPASTATPLPPIAPNVIDRYPARGDELPVDGAITVYFDAPMDRASAEAAFDIEPKVPGTFTWSDSNSTLTFQPSENLKRAARYTVDIGGSARSSAGLALARPTSFNADTVGFLEVTQVLPAADSFDVAVDSIITLMFNRPVVPLTSLSDQANLPQPLSLEPAIDGQGEWLNTSIYIFRPSKPLAGGQTYTGRVAAGLTDTTGGLLQTDFAWSFTAAPPYVVETSPFVNEFDIRLNQPITFTFNQPMDRAATEAAFNLLAPDGSVVGGSFQWDATNKQMGFYPAGRLAYDTNYVAGLSVSARAAGGAALTQAFATPFTTVKSPAILSTRPSNGEGSWPAGNGFQIYFASPMDFTTVEPNVAIVPAPTRVYTYWNDYDFSFYLGWDLEPSTDYAVTLQAGMLDPYGNPALTAPREVTFRTAQLEPQAFFNTGGSTTGLYSAYLDTRFYVTTVNVGVLTFSLHRLSLDQFARLTGPNSWDYVRNFTPAAGDLVRAWDVSVANQLDQRLLTEVPMVTGGGDRLAPGLYFLRMRAPNTSVADGYQILVVSRTNLTLKASLDEALIWATDLNSGQPLADLPITLYDYTFAKLADGVTDKQGVLRVKTPRHPDLWTNLYAVGPAGDAFAVTLLDWSAGVDAWEFGLNSEYFPRDFTGYLYTDRPIYRPGQVVFFKGALRREDDARFSLPGINSVQVVITNDQGEQVYADRLALNAFGTFHGELKLSDDAGLGYYSVNAMLPDGSERSLAYVNFSVAAYRAPEFQVAVSAPQPAVVQGAAIPAEVEASFFFGGPVSNAPVRWAVLSADYVFGYQGQGYYSFEDYDYSAGGPGPQYGTFGELLYTREGVTDGQGRASLNVPADLSGKGRSQLYTIEATVTDLGGQQVAGRTEVVVHQGQFYVGVRPEEYVGTAGRAVNAELIAVDWNSDALANQRLRVEFYDHQWNCALEKEIESGRDVWHCEAQDTLVGNTEVTTDRDGQARASFTPAKGGTYKILAIGVDSGGRTIKASAIVWVADTSFVTWRQENNDRIQLVTDRREYRPGETAEILIPSPFQGAATALITVERGRILRHEVLTLDTNSTVYRLPITADHAPDIFFSVVLIKGVDATNPVPAFKMGVAKLTVSPEQQVIQVTLTPDQSKVGPRDTVNYTLQATDFQGRPVQAEFSLSLVDLAVLQLAPPNAPRILEAFYGERGLGVRTGLGLTVNVNRLNEAADKAKGGGGGAEAGFAEVRGRFLDTAYWNAVVATDASGRAQVSVTLPDNLTTWRLDARGLTANTLVGQATVDIVSTKDLLIRPVTPRFFVVGDQAQLAAVVNNNTAQAIQTTVTLAASGVSISTPATQSLAVPANGRAEVVWDVVVADAPFADLTFSVEGGGLKDASKPTLGLPPDQYLPIYKYSAPETIGTAGQLDDATAVLEAVSLPRRFDATQGDLSVRLAPSLAAVTTDALEALEQEAYYSTDAIISVFVPNVMTYRALQQLNVADSALEARLTSLVNDSLQRLYARQGVDGGWGWWPSEPSDPFITAYALFGMTQAQQAGFSVSEGVRNRAIAFLGEQIINPDETRETWRLNRQAFILFALAEAGEPRNSRTVQLYDRRDRLDSYARALLAMTLARIDPNDARLPSLLADLNNAAILSATGAHWEEAGRDWWNMNTDTRTTAMALEALVRLDPGNALIPNGVRWLMTARRANAWETSQETAWALIALTDWMVLSGELEANYNYRATLNGLTLAAGTVNAGNLRDTAELKVAVADLFKDQANRLVFERGPGGGRLYYTAHLNLYLPVADVRALNRGLMVARQYTLVSDTCGGREQPACPPITQAEAGQDIRVKVTLIAPNDLYYVVLEDPIPAGTELVDTSLQTTSVVGQTPEINPIDPFYYGWGWWWFSNTDLRDEKVVLFASYLPRGTYEYVYTLHASRPGVYSVIPTHARELYFPEVFGRGDGTVFTITP